MSLISVGSVADIFLSFRPFQTSKVWEFVDPETGYEFKTKNREDLIKHIVTYRQQNELEPIEQLDLVLDNYLCALPINAGSCRPDFALRRGLATTLKGGILLLKSMLYNSFAPQEEADRRSQICFKCPHNVFPDRTRFVKWADAIAKAAVGKRRSKFHNELGNCEVCTCPLRAKVFYNGDPELTEEEIIAMEKVGCWQPPLQAQYKSHG